MLRLGRKKCFRYAGADGRKVSRNDLVRIEALKIPPGWTQVAINRAPTGTLQAIGKDAAGRWQYIYHERHVRNRERKKFERLVRFAEAVPRMRRVVSRDLRKRDLGRERVMACILRILATCFMRPGSQVYANENGSYGLATLRPKHVNVRGDTIEFNFPGKGQVAQHRELKDRPVARVVNELLKHRAREVFKYQNGDGQLTKVKRREINAYIKEVMGEGFTAKDFRTWAGTLICACALARVDAEVRESSASRKKEMVSAVKEAAKFLGNTPTVCRSAYICPEVLKSFEHGEVLDHYFNTVGDLVNHRGMKPHKAEKALVRLLKRRSK